jgi:glutamate racemase
LLLDRLGRLAPWPVTFVDPAPAIARRVVDLIGPAHGGAPDVGAKLVFTSGRQPWPTLLAALETMGLGASAAPADVASSV